MELKRGFDRIHPGWGTAAVMALLIPEVVLVMLGALGAWGAYISFFLAPIAFFARTPRSWPFLICVSAALALLPAVITGSQILEPRSASTARTWSREQGWVDSVPPSIENVATTMSVLWLALFVTLLTAFVFWKRYAVLERRLHA
jgi:hypothetical protein